MSGTIWWIITCIFGIAFIVLCILGIVYLKKSDSDSKTTGKYLALGSVGLFTLAFVSGVFAMTSKQSTNV